MNTLRFTFDFTPANDKTSPAAWADWLRDMVSQPDAWPGRIEGIHCEQIAMSGGFIDGRALQQSAHAWSLDKWPDEDVLSDALGVAEEAGEIARAVLKRRHGTRGSHDDWTAQLRTEAADVLLVLMVLAEREGFDLMCAAHQRYQEIKDRDVNHDPVGRQSDDAAREQR